MGYCHPPGLHAAIDFARGLHLRFHGRAPERIERGRALRATPPVLVELGELRAVVYRSDRGPERGRRRSYVHFFADPPRLLSDPEGRRLFIHGGCFRVTRRGIEG